MPHAVDRCAHCGQFDDHPKLHFADQGDVLTFHHDCVPVKVREQVAEHPTIPQIITAAESGIRGDSLRQHIFNLHAQEEN